MIKWHSISNAPKDGTKILGAVVFMFKDKRHVSLVPLMWREKKGEAGWVNPFDGFVWSDVAHWISLPKEEDFLFIAEVSPPKDTEVLIFDDTYHTGIIGRAKLESGPRGNYVNWKSTCGSASYINPTKWMPVPAYPI